MESHDKIYSTGDNMHSSGGDIDAKFGGDRHNNREHTETEYDNQE